MKLRRLEAACQAAEVLVATPLNASRGGAGRQISELILFHSHLSWTAPKCVDSIALGSLHFIFGSVNEGRMITQVRLRRLTAVAKFQVHARTGLAMLRTGRSSAFMAQRLSAVCAHFVLLIKARP
ncbi:hypothetical protein KRR38_09115 [Novosphingobium sp. G106]|uniref:hypothetical protein n=1 Tax=Novosphingobium sp. G106 TaxID=2849500 RepID=UPI001C2D961C|nr:hypothetical protein [Novosphingobium sp. G106]MBV1687830.1 hypothetical protein [Novosphingobium sp. G106]